MCSTISRSIMINKFKTTQKTNQDSKTILDATLLQSIIPSNINITDLLNKQIDNMLGSTQHQPQPQPHRPRASTLG